jgi:hypothetical protein
MKMKMFNIMSVAVNDIGAEGVREYMIMSDLPERDIRKNFNLEKQDEVIVTISECPSNFFHLVMDNAKPVYFYTRRNKTKTKRKKK